jgi:hypothetical protein
MITASQYAKCHHEFRLIVEALHLTGAFFSTQRITYHSGRNTSKFPHGIASLLSDANIISIRADCSLQLPPFLRTAGRSAGQIYYDYAARRRHEYELLLRHH